MVKKTESRFVRSDGLPFIVAGPCSAESLSQMIQSTQPLEGMPVLSALRAGVWKPRTRPGGFEGIGRAALPWLKEAGRMLNLPVMTEVAKPEHVEACLEAGLDMLWIGARTTVNPFYVQELAEAVRGADVSILVKNPIHPEIGLWVGALERFERVGIHSLAAIHRGYFSLSSAPYRNEAGWDQAIALKEQMPELPILCDPSHIAGQRELVPELAEIALELGLDGLMVEVHSDPPNALSDANQQIDPASFKEMIKGLRMHRQLRSEEETPSFIQQRREAIDLLDSELLKILGKRMEHVTQIGREKEHSNLALFQWKRWMEILQNRRNEAENIGLKPDEVEELFRVIHKHALHRQVEEVHRKPAPQKDSLY